MRDLTANFREAGRKTSVYSIQKHLEVDSTIYIVSFSPIVIHFKSHYSFFCFQLLFFVITHKIYTTILLFSHTEL